MPRHNLGRTLRIVAGAAALSLVAAQSALASQIDTIATTAPAATTVAAGATTTVAGATVTDSTTPSQTLLVSLSTNLGTLSLSQTSGLSLAYGYSAFNGANITFTGTAANVTSALATLALTGTGTPGTAQVSITATKAVAGVAYLPADQHYFEFVPTTSLTWAQAQTAANALTFNGQEGYLASIPDATVSSFLVADLAGAQNVWAGGSAATGDYPSGNGPNGSYRAWSWAGNTAPGSTPYGGPLAGEVFTECTQISGACTFTNTSAFFQGSWHSSEPNNSGYSGTPASGEDSLEINYSGAGGGWNDLSNTGSVAGYVAEFGDETTGASAWIGQSTSTASIVTALAPGAPTGISVVGASSTGGQAAVSWTAPSDDGGGAITGYTVTATPASASGAPVTCTATTATTCTLTGLMTGVTYSFTVTATNAIAGTSASPVFTDITDTTPTPTPTPTPAPVTSPAPTCPAPTGSLSKAGVGPLALGMTRAAARAELTNYRPTANGFDDFCLTGTWGIRVAYGNARMLGPVAHASAKARSSVIGRIVVALTANPYYSVAGVRPGTKLAAAEHALGVRRGLTIGRNVWYVALRAHASWLLKVHDGTVAEVGVARRALTASRADQRRFLRHL